MAQRQAQQLGRVIMHEVVIHDDHRFKRIVRFSVEHPDIAYLAVYTFELYRGKKDGFVESYSIVIPTSVDHEKYKPNGYYIADSRQAADQYLRELK